MARRRTDDPHEWTARRGEPAAPEDLYGPEGGREEGAGPPREGVEPKSRPWQRSEYAGERPEGEARRGRGPEELAEAEEEARWMRDPAWREERRGGPWWSAAEYGTGFRRRRPRGRPVPWPGPSEPGPEWAAAAIEPPFERGARGEGFRAPGGPPPVSEEAPRGFGPERRGGSRGRRWAEGVEGGSPRGRFSGVPPKGYRRSDERIHDEACQRLTAADLDCGDVEVAVEEGVIHLRGTACSRADKRYAEDVVLDVPGASDVVHEIRLQRERGREE